jgi:hypothetical protein
VSAEDEITSLTKVGSESTGPRGRAIFSTTNWSVVLEAQGQSPAAEEALERLCRTYWRPVYSFIRREGTSHEEAEDLTQAFFALLLQRRIFDAIRKEKGRPRSYLLTSLKHLLISEHGGGHGEEILRSVRSTNTRTFTAGENSLCLNATFPNGSTPKRERTLAFLRIL